MLTNSFLLTNSFQKGIINTMFQRELNELKKKLDMSRVDYAVQLQQLNSRSPFFHIAVDPINLKQQDLDFGLTI